MNSAVQFILGHMPFIGVSYQSKEKDEEYRKRFSKTTAVRNVIEAAIDSGVSRFAVATPGSSPLSPLHLEVLRLMIDEGYDIELFPCVGIPVKLGDTEIDAYRRWATYARLEKGVYPEVEQRIRNDPILSFRRDWACNLQNSRPYKEGDLRRLSIDWNQVDKDLEYFADLPVAYVELGSETDFLAMAGRFDLLSDLAGRVEKGGFEKILLGVHHAGCTIPMIEDKLPSVHGYVTPLNSIGAMMFPTKAAAEAAVRSVQDKVYAIKPLAGGRVDPSVSFTYVFGFNVKGCMVGVGSVAELSEDLTAATAVLERLSFKSKS